MNRRKRWWQTQNRKVKLAKEELARIIELCESVEKSGIDPFSVNIKELLNKLRRILEMADNLDVIVLDAETLYKISLVIALQHKWLLERAGNLFIDSQIMSAKILAADNKSLALALAKSWRPIVSAEQLTKKMIIEGIEYFLSLPSKIATQGKQPQTEYTTLEDTAIQYELIQDELLEQRMRELHRELLHEELSGKRIGYWDFIRREGDEKSLERAYVLAFLVSEGLADLRREPITGEIWIIPYKEKIERNMPASIAITVRRWR